LTVQVREEGEVRVPLGLDQGILRDERYQGPGEQSLDLEIKGDGHVSWIRGPADGQHNITLKMLVPIAGVGEHNRLRLSVPRATTSELKLLVPVAKAIGKVSEGATLLPAADVEGKGTEFRVLGLAGNFELEWYKPTDQVATVPTVLEAEGLAMARVDSRGVDTKATLTVQSYGAPFDRFRVCLPVGAELTAGSPAGYTVVPVEPPEKESGSRRIVEVRLSQKTSGPVEIQLAARRQHGAAKPNEPFELSGFEVVGAARQTGYISVATESDWQVLWESGQGVRQVDQAPEPLRNKDVFAVFQYFAQPYSLTARLVPKKTRVSVEPEYVLLVDEEQVELRANLKYTVRGAKVFALGVTAPGWEIDSVGPENLVAVDGVTVKDGRRLNIPLLQPTTGQVAVQVRGHQSLAKGPKSLSLALPQPEDVDSPGAAAVVVLPADNVRIVPDAKLTDGLIRQQVAPQMELPARQQPPLFYRGEKAEAVFAGSVEILPQKIEVDSTGRIRVERRRITVEQHLAYTISHEPADALVLDVPAPLAKQDRPEVLYKGKAVAPVVLAHAAAVADAPVSMRIDLPEACIGPCELVVRYAMATPEFSPEPVSVPILLAMPHVGTLTGNRVVVTAEPRIRVEPGKGRWTVSEGSEAAAGAIPLAADEKTSEIHLTVSLEKANHEGTTVVEQAWIQTWLLGEKRRDRSVFVFGSDRKQIDVATGGGAVDAVLLDGVPLAQETLGRSSEEGTLTVPLSHDAKHAYRLELHTHFPDVPHGNGPLSLELAHLAPDVWTRRMYWQLILPQNEHAITVPEGFAAEYFWQWERYFWGRKPLLEQEDLEILLGASKQPPVPERTSRYLFSTMGNTARCALWTARRTWIVLAASGVALAVGLLLIYAPICRRPGALLALAVALFCLGVFYTEAALALAQAAALGLALALLAGLLARTLIRHRRRIAVPETSSSILQRESSRVPYQPPVVGNQISTQTAPAVPPSPADSAP
jgi:hypothetical protein